MLVYEDECVGCPKEMGCLGSSCPYNNSPHLICDGCREEFEKLYRFGSEELCQDCLLEQFERIDLDDL